MQTMQYIAIVTIKGE